MSAAARSPSAVALFLRMVLLSPPPLPPKNGFVVVAGCRCEPDIGGPAGTICGPEKEEC